MDLAKIPFAEKLYELCGEDAADSDELVEDTIVCYKNSPEDLWHRLNGWSVKSCDTLPRSTDHGLVLSQVVHLAKMVPRSEVLRQAREVISSIEAHEAQKVIGVEMPLVGPDGRPVGGN